MPKTPTNIKSLARSHTESVIRRLAKIVTSPKSSDTAAVAAGTALLDRGWGKAAQIVAGDPDNPVHIKANALTDKELARRVALILSNAQQDDTPALPAPVTVAVEGTDTQH